MFLKQNSVHGAGIKTLCKSPFIGEKLQCQGEDANENNSYAVVIVKRTAGYTKNQDSWPQANQQNVVYFFSEMEILNVQ